MEHRTTLVACERELLTGGTGAYSWQLCGTGRGIPVRIDADMNLAAIVEFCRQVGRSIELIPMEEAHTGPRDPLFSRPSSNHARADGAAQVRPTQCS